ncbi:hypothetical protein YPPY14_4584, partial [Yersinia pestis PY-14]
MKILKDYTSYI